MGMVINPFGFGPPPPPVTLGNTAVETASLSASANVQQGFGIQAAVSFTATRFFIRGPTTGPQTFNYRLCIYAATSATVWSGALLGETAQQTALGQSELKEIALLSPVSIVSGNFYALTLHADTPGGSVGRIVGGTGDRFFSDTYSDGAAATAGASASNSTSTRCMYISS